MVSSAALPLNWGGELYSLVFTPGRPGVLSTLYQHFSGEAEKLLLTWISCLGQLKTLTLPVLYSVNKATLVCVCQNPLPTQFQVGLTQRGVCGSMEGEPTWQLCPLQAAKATDGGGAASKSCPRFPCSVMGASSPLPALHTHRATRPTTRLRGTGSSLRSSPEAGPTWLPICPCRLQFIHQFQGFGISVVAFLWSPYSTFWSLLFQLLQQLRDFLSL